MTTDVTSTGLRQDIQVLRGFAVVIVLLYHLGYDFPAGGFLGVDIFFVISGYLITQILARDRDAGRFSLRGFYFRRAKRLLPAGLTIILLTSIASLWLLTSLEMEDFTSQLVGAVTFTTNWVLVIQAGYFGEESVTKPFLHLWSLAIEGQFYLLLPIVLMWLNRRWWLPVLAVIGLASVVFYLIELRANADYAFYWTWTRIWELLIGGVAALLSSRLMPQRAMRVLFWPALAVMLALAFEPDLAPGEGLDVVLSCLAAALVILRQHPIFETRWLRPLSNAGDASYSLYLAHWPPLAFLYNAYFGPPGVGYRLAALVIGVIVGLIVYRFVETPFRGKWLGASWRSAVAFVVASALVLAVHAGVSYASVDPRFDYATARAPNYGISRKCNQMLTYEPVADCESKDTPAILVWGDSFSMHLVAGIVATSTSGVRQAARSSCSPYVTATFYVGQSRAAILDAERCLTFHKSVLERLAESPSIKLVVLSSPFAQVYRRGLVETPDGLKSVSATRELMYRSIDDTIAAIRKLGKQVVVVSGPPREQGDTSLCLERAGTGKLLLGKKPDCTISRSLSDRIHKDVNAFLTHVEAGGTEVIWLADGLCEGNICKTSDNGVPIYRNRGHLSVSGSVYLAKTINLGGHLDDLVRAAGP